MHVVLANQIADILDFNDNVWYKYNKNSHILICVNYLIS